MLKKLFSHTILYALGPQIPKLANIALLPIITKYLTPLDYGVYGTIMAYNGLLMGLQTLGLDVLLVNSFFKKPNRWRNYWRRYSGILYLWKQLFTLIYIIILYLIIPEEVGGNKTLLIALLVIPNYLFSVVNSLGGRYFQIAQKPQRIFITTAITGTATIIISYYCIVILKIGYMGWYYSAAAGAFIMFCSYFWPIMVQLKLYPIFSLKKSFVKNTLKVGLPTLPHNYSAYLLNSSDRLVMDQLHVSIDNIGKYNMAYIIGNYFEILGTAVGMAVGPYYTKLFSKENPEAENQARDLTFFLQIGFILLSFTASLWAKEIFNILISNEELSSVYYIAIIIIMGYSYRPMYWASISKLFYLEKTNQLWKVSTIGGILNVGLNLIFIPIYGFEAAAITTFISLLYIGFAGFYLKDYKQNNNLNYYPIRWLILILMSLVTVYFLKDISIFLKSIVTLGLIISFFIYFISNKNKLNSIEL
ncbi:polysaccharide biosynthesis C-terminal domain-containing protein [Gelidibacter sp. F63206]|uniref:polysaccharide biosynthesis C-terminal domain-containing protein n=1 Tax=Gelidibacter sp. F63206 TaxID=2926425 RepID=UPI001FF4D532|nr:oligosaccharide flippase family protein [Gelidibacter sp. F63206]MCK0115075.1 oligosaccharide flippase family protein [Gelidibacter sp. F63206]